MPRWAAQQPQDFSFATEIAGAAARPIAVQDRSYPYIGKPSGAASGSSFRKVQASAL